MTDIEHVAERLRQIAESQRMDFDSPNVAMTLDESADALESTAAERDEARANLDREVQAALDSATRIYKDRTEKAEAERDALRAVIDEALAIHADAGASQGYLPDGGYGTIDHCCGTCGEFGEYGVPWPCPTARILSRATTTEGERDA